MDQEVEDVDHEDGPDVDLLATIRQSLRHVSKRARKS